MEFKCYLCTVRMSLLRKCFTVQPGVQLLDEICITIFNAEMRNNIFCDLIFFPPGFPGMTTLLIFCAFGVGSFDGTFYCLFKAIWASILAWNVFTVNFICCSAVGNFPMSNEMVC